MTAGIAFRPETAKPIRTLAEVLLRGPGTLTSAGREIHDAVLIAADFSMFNRYVDGLAAFTPTGGTTARGGAAWRRGSYVRRTP